MLNLLGLRIVPAYFLQANKSLFEQWHYNSCNQTALIAGYCLDILLNSSGAHQSNPFTKGKFEITVKEGIFREPLVRDDYNHAWTYATNGYYSFLVDVGRISNPTIFKTGPEVINNPELYCPNYSLISSVDLNYKNMLGTEREYYTGKPSLNFCLDIQHQMEKLGFFLRHFDWNV
jgi:hypothetical protein